MSDWRIDWTSKRGIGWKKTQDHCKCCHTYKAKVVGEVISIRETKHLRPTADPSRYQAYISMVSRGGWCETLEEAETYCLELLSDVMRKKAENYQAYADQELQRVQAIEELLR